VRQVLIAQTTSDLIAAELRQEILRGQISPGSPLRQELLAKRFSVSRIPVREALRALERDGLVEVHPNRGAYVVELSPAQIVEIIDLRILIEGDLIARSVPRMSESDVRAVTAAADVAAAAASTPEWNETDRRFHEILYAPAERPRQLAIAMALRRSIERYWAIYRQLPARRAEWLRDHEHIVAACRDGDDKRAKRELADHIRRAGEFLIERLQAAAPHAHSGAIAVAAHSKQHRGPR
jgi:DNA-binding GntR family transcriptional regulator